VGPEITAGLIVFPSAQARAILMQYRDAVDAMPADMTVWAVLRKAPPLPFLPTEAHGQDVLVLPVFSPSRSASASWGSRWACTSAPCLTPHGSRSSTPC
jgi:hypothetical protein